MLWAGIYIATTGMAPVVNKILDLFHTEDGGITRWIASQIRNLWNRVMTPIKMTRNPSRELQRHPVHHNTEDPNHHQMSRDDGA